MLLTSKPAQFYGIRDHVFANGAEVLPDGEPTSATPGRVLRAGRDTATVLTP